MRARIALLLALLLLGSVLLPVETSAQEAAPAENSVVYGVFYYSPSCPHCHEVIQNTLPVLFDTFGSSFYLLPVDVTTREGGALFTAMCSTVGTQLARCGSVPALVIGNTILVGSGDIPAFTDGLIRTGLAVGGVPLPDIPGIGDYYVEYEAARLAALGESPDTAAADSETTGAQTALLEETLGSESLGDKLANDPAGNALAVLMLVALIVSAGLVIYAGWKRMLAQKQWDRYAIGASALVGLGLALSLALDDEGEFLATGLALGLLGVMLALGASLMYPQVFKYAVPITAVAGLCVATYLAHIETTDNSAVCGIVGDCNTVQQSEYAEFLGLPVGVLGMFGYALLTIVWFIGEVTDEPRHKRLAQIALLGMALGGAAFSIYLTFLEPFVIGATCAWCLLSALTMLLILWLVAPEGFAALDEWRRPRRRSRRRRHTV